MKRSAYTSEFVHQHSLTLMGQFSILETHCFVFRLLTLQLFQKIALVEISVAQVLLTLTWKQTVCQGSVSSKCCLTFAASEPTAPRHLANSVCVRVSHVRPCPCVPASWNSSSSCCSPLCRPRPSSPCWPWQLPPSCTSTPGPAPCAPQWTSASSLWASR